MAQRGWGWRVDVVPDPDKVLREAREEVVATADSVVLDACAVWMALRGRSRRRWRGPGCLRWDSGMGFVFLADWF